MTRAELLEATARELHILAGTQPLAAGPQARLLAKYLALHGELLKETLATWAAAEDIPAECEEPVILMLAARSCRLFGVGPERRAELILLGTLHGNPISQAERQLRKAITLPYISKPLETCQY